MPKTAPIFLNESGHFNTKHPEEIYGKKGHTLQQEQRVCGVEC
jgi:hypothetical protein